METTSDLYRNYNGDINLLIYPYPEIISDLYKNYNVVAVTADPGLPPMFL